ncbi:Hypothetical protein NTJ_09573 [Nesidiocoris tenuis]|uniref:Uncharacterized protein n=1 Tax=Nesidiocoris tenuis TaxID=355587 RepID=A0ABN7AX41_9HEMI|nr:Hypothetical protein NTJ_09573 [Nesidiocoris tenuis]
MSNLESPSLRETVEVKTPLQAKNGWEPRWELKPPFLAEVGIWMLHFSPCMYGKKRTVGTSVVAISSAVVCTVLCCA